VLEERRPDGSYEYQVVVITVPRQTGKTTLMRALGTKRALAGRDVFYTAQTGKDARERWADLVKILRLSPIFGGDRIKVSLRGGSEQVAFADAGAFRVFAPTPQSLHGYTPPTVIADEVFALAPGAGELLMGAIGPAQITIRDRQIILVSTAGTAESVFLHDWIDRASQGMDRVALLDWGARDDQDPYSLEDITAFHPGVGFELNGKVLEAADVLAQVDRNTRAEYERAYANRRTTTGTQVITPARWRELATGPDYSGEDRVIAYDVDADRRGASIVCSWRTSSGVAVKIVRAEGGTSWLAPAVADLVDQWRPSRPPLAAANGPVLEVTAELRERLGYDVDELTEREYAAASSWLLNAVDDGELEHDGDLALEQSATGVVLRGFVDGVAISRRHSIGDSSAAVAAAIAGHAASNATGGKPMARFAA
jgi:hypothetical protein